MVQMEEELGEALPYWDWTEDAELPHFWSEIEAPIKEGVDDLCSMLPPKCNGQCDPTSRFVLRFDNVKIDTEMQKKESREAFLETDYYRFVSAIGTPHDFIHQRIGSRL